jgi:hypothetical protein
VVVDLGTALSTYAQVAIGLAGFSSILIALSGRPSLWGPIDSFRITILLTSSFLSVLLSLLPITLAFFSMADASVWRISLAVLALATLVVVVVSLIKFRQLSSPDRLVIRPALVVLTCTILAVSALAEVNSALGTAASGAGVFFAGLVVLFALSIYVVIRFLFARPTD